MDLPCEITKANGYNGYHEGQRSIESNGLTKDISATPVGRQSEVIACADLNLRSDSRNSLDDGIASSVMLDEYPSELRKRRNHSVDGTKRGRSNRAKTRESVGQDIDIPPTESGGCNESNRKIGLLSLPGEIRNQIMDLVLVPGHVYFPTNKMQLVDRNRSPVSRPRFQVLATCRQLYQEGHVLFYSQNVFHLAPGPISASWDYIRRLDSRHQDLITKVSVDISVMDLTPPVLEGIQAAFYEDHGQSIAHAEDNMVYLYIRDTLGGLWAEKIAGVSDTRNFQTIRVVDVFPIDVDSPYGDFELCSWKTLHLEGAGVHKLLSSVKIGKGCQIWTKPLWDIHEHWDGVLLDFFKGVVANIMGTLLGMSGDETSGSCWDNLKRWMRELKIGIIEVDSIPTKEKDSWSENSGWVHSGEL